MAPRRWPNGSGRPPGQAGYTPRGDAPPPTTAPPRPSDSQAHREQVKALEAEVRALREAQGELLELLRPLGETCLTCGREMVEYGSGDDRNCGGDCWGCIKSVEVDGGSPHG